MAKALWYPEAIKRPMGFAHTMPNLKEATAFIYHTNAGKGDLPSYINKEYHKNGSRIGPHLQFLFDGTPQQLLPLNKEAFANYTANRFAFAGEFQDDGNPDRPMTTEQVESSIRFLKWAKSEGYNIPFQLAKIDGHGIGWHCLYHDWNQTNHSCPNPAKISQVKGVIDYLSNPPLTTKGPDMFVAHTPQGHYLIDGFYRRGLKSQEEEQNYLNHGVGIIELNQEEFDALKPLP